MQTMKTTASVTATEAPALSQYDQQVADFLSKTGIALRITLSDTKPATWEPAGHHYRCTFSRKPLDTEEHLISAPGSTRLTFDFWDSAANAEAGKPASAYSVLSCVASEIHMPSTFADYCSEFGAEEDSISAKQTWTRAHRFAERLRAFFSVEEAAQLATIQ